MHILFVCTGNICRSPTAERLASAYGAKVGLPDFTASSAGTRAVIGHGIHSEAAAVLEKLGGDVSGFAARQLTAKLASAADLIVTMSSGHRDKVLEFAPQKLKRTFTLSEVSRLLSVHGALTIPDLGRLRPQLHPRLCADIIDPINQSPEVFEVVGAQIAELLLPVLELCARSSAPPAGS